MTKETHHVAKYKKNLVHEFKELIKQYPVIATINMENMPTAQLQKMRQQLRDKVVLLMTKRRLMKIAIEESKDVKKKVEELNKYLKGMPALMFTNENPFKLYKMLEKSKTNAPAKPGQIAPKDILIQAGPTPFAPGPVISELTQIGLKTGVEGGKVAIKEDKVVVKEGEKVNDKVASILLRLGITPMEIGMDLVAAYEDGTIFTKDVLAVDEKEFIKRIVTADTEAFNLGVEIKYPAQRILEYLIGKAFNDSKALALGQNIISSVVAEELLSKAEREVLSLKEAAKIEAVEEKPKEAVKEEKVEKPKEEIKKEEPKVKEKKVEEKPKVKDKPKEEIKKEEAKPEVKEEKVIKKEPIEKKSIKEDLKIEKPEVKVEEKKEEPIETKPIEKKDIKKEKTTEEKVKKLVEKIKKREPTAEELVEGVEEKEVKEEKKEELPTAEELVKKTKEFIEGKKIKAEDLIAEEAKKADESREIAEEIVRRIQKGEEIKKEDIPSIAELAEKRKKKSLKK